MDIVSNALSDTNECSFDHIIMTNIFTTLAWQVLLDTQMNNRKYELAQGMWSKDPNITKALFNNQKNNLSHQLIQGMWSEESGMTTVLFDTQENSLKYQFTQCI